MTIDFSDRFSISSSAEVALVRRFTGALRTAIYDKKLEQQEKIIYYFDADVVISMILGFQQFKYAAKASSQQRSERALFVRSLLSFGYMGTLSLLRPHAFELDDVLRRKPAFRSDLGRDDYRRELHDFLTAWGVSDHFAHLSSVLSKSSKSESIDKFLGELQRIGPEAFVPIELANGTWQQRLVRFGRKGILHFDSLGDDIKQILADSALEEFRALIAQERKPDQKRLLSLSIVRDAMALTCLYRLIRRRKNDSSVPYVRFYTETDVLQNAWRNSARIRLLLSYNSSAADCVNWEDCPDFIGRTSDYFVVRALFEALHFPNLKLKKSSDQPAVSLASLEEVSRDLEAIPRDDSEHTHNVLASSQSLGGQSIGDYLKLFGSLSFIRSIWMRYEPPLMLERFIEGFQEVWGFAREEARSEEIRRRVSRDLEQVQSQLHTEVESLREWFSILTSIQERSKKYFKSHDEYFIPPNPLLDLGLVRWGINDLSDNAKRRFRDLVAPLISREVDDWWQGCADLTSAIRDIGNDEEECAVICSILWWLNDFNIIEQLLGQLGSNFQGRGPLWAKVMRAAARLQNRNLSFEDKRDLVERTKSLVLRLTKKKRRFYLIGLAYILFHAWSSEASQMREDDCGEENGRRAILQSWVQSSFDLGEEAYSGLERGTLQWAFAVNHCAYVGSVANIEPSKTLAYLQKLGSFENNADLWNYRFVDTFAYSFYLDAKRLWEARDDNGPRSELEVLRHKVWGTLKNAYDVYERARQYFGDREIPAHQNELNQLARETDYPYILASVHSSQRVGHESVPDRV